MKKMSAILFGLAILTAVLFGKCIQMSANTALFSKDSGREKSNAPTAIATTPSVEQTASAPNSEAEQLVASWQETYAALLRTYALQSDRMYFLLHDFDKDGIPELIVAGEYEDEDVDAVFTFRDGKVLPLEYDEEVLTAGSILLARGGVAAAPGDEPGLTSYFIGPSAGEFGPNRYYKRIVIDRHKLEVDARGRIHVDVETLLALFGDFYRGADIDNAVFSAAIEENTHYYINDIAVTEEELYRMFRTEAKDLSPVKITEDNIRDLARYVYG